MLVPLTKSLYAPGKLGDTDKVLIDVGTGYFIEYTAQGGADYCKRKVNMLRENLDKLGEVRDPLAWVQTLLLLAFTTPLSLHPPSQLIGVKRRQLGQVQGEMQRKMAQFSK